MHLYHWITIILAADILLVLFVRGADSRREESQQKTEWRRA